MSVDLKNSETLKNLMRAFAGESQARNRYTFAASVCRQQKLHVVEAVFRFTADQEKEHAEIFSTRSQRSSGPMATASAGWRICWNRESCLSPMSSAPGCA